MLPEASQQKPTNRALRIGQPVSSSRERHNPRTQVACTRCRKRKAKCAKHPIDGSRCERCSQDEIEEGKCLYRRRHTVSVFPEVAAIEGDQNAFYINNSIDYFNALPAVVPRKASSLINNCGSYEPSLSLDNRLFTGLQARFNDQNQVHQQFDRPLAADNDVLSSFDNPQSMSPKQPLEFDSRNQQFTSRRDLPTATLHSPASSAILTTIPIPENIRYLPMSFETSSNSAGHMDTKRQENSIDCSRGN